MCITLWQVQVHFGWLLQTGSIILHVCSYRDHIYIALVSFLCCVSPRIILEKFII